MDLSLHAILEAVLFAAGRPLGVKTLAAAVDASQDEVVAALKELASGCESGDRGLRILTDGVTWSLVTAKEAAKAVEEVAKVDEAGELTRPALETLTVIAYKGPITKPEIEAVRGVNCTLVLRNLLVRGLVDEKEESPIRTVYTLSHDAMRYLGITKLAELPHYDRLHKDTTIERLLAALETPQASV
jgi:segregation and condensation protein B